MTTITDVTRVASTSDEALLEMNAGACAGAKPHGALASRECIYGLAAIVAALLMIFTTAI
jgi:hypothetical protein